MSDEAPADTPFQLRDLAFSVYVPTVLFSIGQGAVIPIIPLFAKDLGASVVVAALMVACRGFGMLVFDLPAGVFVSRWGDKWGMVAGAVLVGIVGVGAGFRPSIGVLAGLIVLMGGGWSFWMLARLSYVADQAPLAQRGRAIAMVGGLMRVGNFIGPVLGGALASGFGFESAFIAQAALGASAAAVMFLAVGERRAPAALRKRSTIGSLLETAADSRGVLLAAGPAIYALAVLRQGRQVFLPLWGDSIGVGVAEIGLITGLSFLIDATVFYPSGMLMDRAGRKWAAVPCLVVLSVGMLLLPATGALYSFAGVAVIMGAGNGLGAGIVQILGADLAPPDRRGEFLGLWRLMSDTGQVGGPLMISGLIGVASLGVASLASGGVGLLGALTMVLFIRETLQRSGAEESQSGRSDAPT